MGKSDKKYQAKSERINALRKQYDAFLAEDKKRKERNEYILKKLDKMRHVTALVPLHHKSSIHVDAGNPLAYKRSVMPEKSFQLSRPKPSHLELNIPRNGLEDIPLINEISKKYILIPKIRQTTNDYVEDLNQKNYDSTDWKSKYDILEQLKINDQKEQVDVYKVSSPDDIFSKPSVPNTPSMSNGIDKGLNINKYQTQNKLASDYKNDLPEKDLGDRKPYYEFDVTNKYVKSKARDVGSSDDKNILAANKEIPDLKISQNNSVDNLKSNNVLHETNLGLDCRPTETANNKSKETPKVEITNNNVKRENSIKPMTFKEHLADNEKNNIEDSEKVVLQDRDHIGSAQIISPNNCITELNNEVPQTEDKILTDHMESSIEVTSSQEFTPNNDMISEDSRNIYPNEDLVDQSNLKISNPHESQMRTETEHVQNPSDTSENQQLNAVQPEILYSENTDANYAYNQEHEGNPYNGEYPPQSENYIQNEEIGYYEGTQPDQTYPVETNEPEASSEHYDQTYGQQYANFEQPEYVQQQEGYEEHEQQQVGFDEHEQQPVGYEEQVQQQVGYDEQVQQQVDYEEHPQQQVRFDEHAQQPVGYEEQVQQQVGYNEKVEYEEHVQQPVGYEEQVRQQVGYEEQEQHPVGYEEQVQQVGYGEQVQHPVGYQEHEQEQVGYEEQVQQFEPHPASYEPYDQTQEVSGELQYEHQQNINTNEQVDQLHNEQGLTPEENIETDKLLAQGNTQGEQEKRHP